MPIRGTICALQGGAFYSRAIYIEGGAMHMAHGFADRLDRIMAATRTSNSALARAMSFDASYISRIRNGKRGLPAKQPFIGPAAAYLAGRVCDERTRRSASSELGRLWPEDAAEATALLESWLAGDGAHAEGLAVQQLIESLEVPDRKAGQAAGAATAQPHRRESASKVAFFYGNDGKRSAVRIFLSQLAETGEPQTLLLHSSEDMTWLHEDEGFAKEWEALMLTLAENGGRTRIIHSISREANEMWEATRIWLPLYATGTVEPYYYPLLRDGVYLRTLFIAEGHSAIASTSLGSASDSTGWLNMLVSDKHAVAALECEFSSYLALCSPLMKVHTPENAAGLARIAAGFAEGASNMLAFSKDGKLVCSREDGRGLLVIDGPTPIAFETAEARMAGSIWEYLRSLPAHEVHRGEDARNFVSSLVP